ncbi:hypothetical protein V1477_002947 [Vespula maculifrons]|uniref:Uncharacterized protein n=1 Tax=Vespula maculifrons TaxID=7453 RepID=A0ABD2CUL4_VESMC
MTMPMIMMTTMRIMGVVDKTSKFGRPWNFRVQGTSERNFQRAKIPYGVEKRVEKLCTGIIRVNEFVISFVLHLATIVEVTYLLTYITSKERARGRVEFAMRLTVSENTSVSFRALRRSDECKRTFTSTPGSIFTNVPTYTGSLSSSGAYNYVTDRSKKIMKYYCSFLTKISVTFSYILIQ